MVLLIKKHQPHYSTIPAHSLSIFQDYSKENKQKGFKFQTNKVTASATEWVEKIFKELYKNYQFQPKKDQNCVCL